MAHFAKIGLNNKVIQIVRISNDELLDSNGNEVEINGVNFLTQLTGWAIWKQTSYNTQRGVHLDSDGTPLRKNFAGIGFTYDEDRDAFIPPKPFASWTLNESTCMWDPPTPHPNDGKLYDWNEGTTSWDSDST